MKKLSIITVLLFMGALTVSAQGQQMATIMGTLLDESTKETIPGAVIELSPVNNPEKAKHYSSEQSGRFSITNLPYGEYDMKITFLGYEDYMNRITVDKTTLNLDNITMKLASHNIDKVVMEAQAIRTTQRGDTVIYNASAYKVSQDADAESLLSKMPGITVTNGSVEAQGETVKKVFVDGKEFFGNDVNAVIKTLPAEAVKSVEVFNKKSDRAEFTGIDDGEGYKALNFVTNMSHGQFGKFSANYGFKDKYMVGGNYNYFKNDTRFSITGLSNNINQHFFSSEDILGVMGGGVAITRGGGGGYRFEYAGGNGIAKVNSIGLNYNDKWGKKFDASLSYSFSNRKTTNNKIGDRQYFSSTDSFTREADTTNSTTRNNEHRVNSRIDYKINDNNLIMVRSDLSFQDYKSLQNGNQYSFMTDESPVESLLSSIVNSSDSKNTGYNLSNAIIYRTKLGKPGRTLTLDANGRMNTNDRTGYTWNTAIYPPAGGGDNDTVVNNRYTTNNSKNWNLSGNIMYTEPISANTQLTAEYRASYRYSDADRKVYLWDDALGMFDPEFSEENSNIYNSGYLTHRVGPGFNWSNDKRDVINGGIYYQRSILTRDQKIPSASARKLEHSFDNIVYTFMLNKSFNSTNTMRVHARSSTNNPSITQLQDVIDESSIKNVTSGNPNLKPAYSHNIMLSYNRSNITKGATFMIFGGINLNDNYITDSIVINNSGSDIPIMVNGEEYILGRGNTFTKPVNVNGRWSLNSNMSIGFPLKFIKSNANFSLSAMYTESPSIINGEKNKQKGQYYTAGLTLGSNIDKVDFTLSYNGGYNTVNNSLRKDNNNTYLNHSASVKLKVEMWAGITFTANGTYTGYKGITSDLKEEYIFVNMYIGKKFLKSRRAELSFGVNDMLNQNTSFSRNVTDTYIENVRNSALGRYYGFQFTYTLRSIGKFPENSGPRRDFPGGGFRGFPGGGHRIHM